MHSPASKPEPLDSTTTSLSRCRLRKSKLFLPVQMRAPTQWPSATRAGEMGPSLCETCQRMRAVITPKGSRFLLCHLSTSNPNYPKYPPQPIVRCEGYPPSEAVQATEKNTILSLCTRHHYRT